MSHKILMAYYTILLTTLVRHDLGLSQSVRRHEAETVVLFKMEVLLLILIFQIAGGTSPRKFSRTVLESSNNPNLSISSIPPVDKGEKVEDDSNSTWKTKGFSTKDVNILRLEYPNSFFLPQKSPSYMNSSRLFHATNTGDLTVIFRQFKHSLVYLNFSYYIGTVPEKKNETEVELVKNSTNETGQVPVLMELSPTGLLENQTIDLEETNGTNATEIPEPIPIFHDLARRKRSIENSAEQSNSSNATSPEAKNSSSPSDILEHSNTLLQAVEMIKTAAAALTKETLTDPNKTPTGNENDKKETKDKPKSKEEEEHHHHHRHRKPEILHKGSKGKKNKKSNKKHEKLPEHVGSKNEEEESSSSSSSEEDERGKKKISYKTWKASFEKRNRPPGLYVTVNDDIIFDNWEGLWDKHFVMGKWTGANTKPLGEGMWNQTQLFINWEDVPMNVLKITFEWEPMTPNSYLILSDITVSTVETATCSVTEVKMVHRHDHEPKMNKSESEREEKGEKPATSQSTAKPTTATSTTTAPESSTAAPLIIIKNGEVEGSFQIIKLGKTGEPEIEHVKYQELERNSSTHRIGDEMLKTLLKLMKNDNKTNNSIPSTSTTLSSALVSEEPSHEVKNLSSQGKEEIKKRERNEDRETAVLISVVTGSIAITILVLTLKKYVELSKSKNNNGNDRND